MKKSWLTKKNIVITGASSGIGKEITKILIKEFDCNVLGIARNEQKMLALKEELVKNQENFSFKLFDVSVKENWEDFFKFVLKQKLQIDVLINCAGQLPSFDKFENCDLEVLENIMQVNFYSAVYSTKYLLPILKQSSKPIIVNISSSASLCALPGISLYTASKSALKNFTEALDAEIGRKVRVSLVCPGFTKTDIFRNQKNTTQESIIDKISMRADKMAAKIVKAIRKRKRRSVFGVDAHLMNLLYKFFPRSAGRICGFVLKKAKVKLFSDVFNEKGSEK